MNVGIQPDLGTKEGAERIAREDPSLVGAERRGYDLMKLTIVGGCALLLWLLFRK